MVDIFGDYDGNFFANLGLIEVDGWTNQFFPSPNYDSNLAMVDQWDNPALPVTLKPGESATDSDLSGSWANQISYTGGDLAAFLGSGTFVVGCAAQSVDALTATGGSSLRGHEAFAECGATVTYDYTDTPIPSPLVLIGMGVIAMASTLHRRRPRGRLNL